MLNFTKIKLLTLLLLSSLFLFSQNKIDLFLTKNNVFYIDENKIDSLKITSIEYMDFLTIEEKKSPEINNNIFSKYFEYQYKGGKLIKISWEYSGIDSLDVDHLKSEKPGFKEYPYLYEDYIIYDETGKLKRIDQSTPHEISKKFQIYNRVISLHILINGIPADHFLFSHFNNDIDEVIIELGLNKYLQFQIY